MPRLSSASTASSVWKQTWMAATGGDKPSHDVKLLPELRQNLRNLLLTGHDLSEKADAVDLAGVVPGCVDEDARLVLGSDGQAVHRLRQRLAIELAELLGDISHSI